MVILLVDKLESKFIGSLIGTGLGDSIGRSREGRGMISGDILPDLKDGASTHSSVSSGFELPMEVA